MDILGIAPWVKSMLGEVPEVRDTKAVHCPVLGTHVLSPHEIAILDTPLLQRLRYISQTGFVYLTFPGARHSRLEHTLGTIILAERYAQAINLRTGGGRVLVDDHSSVGCGGPRGCIVPDRYVQPLQGFLCRRVLRVTD